MAVAAALLAGSLWTVPAPAAADWLVTRDGGRVETRGAWKVQGKRVVFTARDGTLASLRLAEVDLDASREATASAAQAALAAETAETAKPAEPPKKPVRVLTDKDFAHPEAPPADSGTAGNPDEKPAAALPENGALKVQDWKQSRDPERDVLAVTGSVSNTGPDLATAVSVTVRLYDARGEELATRQASLVTRTLKPGQNTSFQAEFPGLVAFTSAKFEVRSIPLVRREGTP
jgi:hypothetical protein